MLFCFLDFHGFDREMASLSSLRKQDAGESKCENDLNYCIITISTAILIKNNKKVSFDIRAIFYVN